MRGIDIQAESHVERNGRSFDLSYKSTDFNRAAHTPVIESTPTRAEECIGASLVEGQCHIRDFARGYVNWFHIHLSNSESMHDIIGGQVQDKWLANLSFQRVRGPAAFLGHADVDQWSSLPKKQRYYHCKYDPSDNQYTRDKFGAFHSNNQSMIAVRMKQYRMTGMAETFTSFEAFCAVRADQIRPPTSARVWAGASKVVSIGCHARAAVPNKFQPRPSGSDSAAKL